MRTLWELLRGFLVVWIFAPVAVYIYSDSEAVQPWSFRPRSYLSWTWRIILGDFLYFILYGLAGFALVSVYPTLMDFYGDKVPPMELIIQTQLFLRGFIFMAIAYIILRFINLPLGKRALLVGLTFSVFGGIAPLITPNELMPHDIRMGHLVEVGISNFVYGALLGFLIGQRRMNPEKIKSE